MKNKPSKMSQEITKLLGPWAEVDRDGTTLTKQLLTLCSTAVDQIIGEDDKEKFPDNVSEATLFNEEVKMINNLLKKDQRKRKTRWFDE